MHYWVADLKKFFAHREDAWRLLVPVPADSKIASNSMASAMPVALLHYSEVFSPETVPSPQEFRNRVAGVMVKDLSSVVKSHLSTSLFPPVSIYSTVAVKLTMST